MKIEYFSSPGCAPCKQLWPHVEAACVEFGVTLRRHELTPDNSAAFDQARAHGVSGVPTMIAYNEQGIEVGRHKGALGPMAARGQIKLWSFL